jgi:hypothetical protein
VTVVSHKLIVDACNVLFGPEVVVSMDFLRYLQPSGVKAAFRKKALETHPDRAKILGMNEAQMLQQFKNVNDAYKRLYPIVSGASEIIITPPGPARHRAKKYAKQTDEGGVQKNWAEGIYSGRIPRRELLLGRFMYYSSTISWDTLIKALAWQKRQRPLIGQLAISRGLLTLKEIQAILCKKRHNEKFGQCANRAGYLKWFNIMTLLNKQRECQRLFGDYFIDKNIFGAIDIKRVVKNQHRHNEKIKAAAIRRKFK